MLDTNGTEDYWLEQTKKGHNPCHYHNVWQDRYAYHIRTGAFSRRDFAGAREVVDVGCGVGEYLEAIHRLAPNAHFTGFDFPFNIEIVQRIRGTLPQTSFVPKPLPRPEVVEAIKKADVVYTTTVYVHLSAEARLAFFEGIAGMKKGSKILLLEYIPESVPSFQKGLSYKEVETLPEIKAKFEAVGATLSELRHVNFIDSFLFFHLGKNWFVYTLTLFLDSLYRMVGATKSKYKMLVFTR